MSFWKKKTTTIELPQTVYDFEELVTTLIDKYDLPNWEHCAAIVATRIQHMPPDQATTTMEYLRDCVRKNIAFQIAQAQHSKINHKTQVDQLMAALKSNPLDQQIRDQLDKAVAEGSDYARQELEKFNPAEDTAAPAVSSEFH